MMEGIVGRVADFLIKKDGSKVAGVSLIENTLTRIHGIQQMQIIQEAMDSFVINVIPGVSYDHTSAQELKNYFYELFGNDIGVKIPLWQRSCLNDRENSDFPFVRLYFPPEPGRPIKVDNLSSLR